jgi:hypothetical protein
MWSVTRWIHKRGVSTIGPPALAAAGLLAVLLTGVAGTWAIGSVPHVMATRAQLALVAREDPRADAPGVQLVPLRLLSSEDALQRLEISTSPLDVPPPGVLLSLSEVPPGDYRLRFRFAAEPRGEVRLLVGGAGGPLATWHVADPDNTYRVRLPVHASTVAIAADAAAAESIRSVALIPVRHATTPWAAATRARAAARYGQTVVYAIDNRVILEPDGFWVLGGRQPDVVITTDGSRPALVFQVANVAIQNRVRVSSGAWSATRDLEPDERWLVTVPLADSAEPAMVNFRVEQGVVADGRMLGCHVSVADSRQDQNR